MRDLDDRAAALTSPSRLQVLDALAASDGSLDAATVAVQIGLHITTARFHLDQLAAAGLVQRESIRENRRGRPRVLYRRCTDRRAQDTRDQLIHVLAAALARESDPTATATRAGRAWARSFDSPDPENPIPDLAQLLEQLGFDPVPNYGTGAIGLTSCPFREAARVVPQVVCAVHAGLVSQFVEGGTHTAVLEPFVQADLCVVTVAHNALTAVMPT